ncbi:hypothetical protein [Mycobacteroides abscessus]|uniref:hypothetical protein n=1 Tax=Mycobacteroides abscessus TaxID=36809 RepID=UPI0013000DB5
MFDDEFEITDEFLKTAFDWAFLSDGLLTPEVKKSLTTNLKNSYPELYREWYEGNTQYFSEEEKE